MGKIINITKQKGESGEEMKYIDLSYDIKSEMPVYPGDMELNSNKEKDYDKDGYNLYSFSTSMHVGTHIDAPLHMGKNKKFIYLNIR